MQDIFDKVGQALLMAAGMAWQTGWTLVLGFTISALLQSIVSTDQMKKALGRSGPKELALASIAGAASSSCSYASAAIMRTCFKKGAALATSLAFMFASDQSRPRTRCHPLPAAGLAVHGRRVDWRDRARCGDGIWSS